MGGSDVNGREGVNRKDDLSGVMRKTGDKIVAMKV